MKLRDYQQEAIDSVFEFVKTQEGNPCIVAPTGSGKSLILAGLIKEVSEATDHRARIIVLSHRKEILTQNAEKLYKLCPEISVGVFSAGLGSKRISRVTVAGIQSVHRHAEKFGHVDLVIVDEAHLIPPSGEGQYQKFLKELKKINPNLTIVGLTATPFRLDSGSLVGEDKLLNKICYNIELSRLIDDKHLSPLVGKASKHSVDTSNIEVARGDFVTRQASEAFDKEHITNQALDEVFKLASDRKSWLFFGVDVAHCKHLGDKLRERNISCEVITGETLPMIRESSIAKFKTQKIKALVNCEVLTTGFDAPNLDLIVLLRPTQSVSLYMQMLGRGMRTFPEKQNCLVLDYGGNLLRHGPIDLIRINDKKKRPGQGAVDTAPSKACPECDSVMHAASRECAECGYEFPEKEILHETQAAVGAFLSTNAVPEHFEVRGVNYSRHVKRGGEIATMRVDYQLVGAVLEISEWVCLEHEGYAKNKAQVWWISRGGEYPCPNTVEEAMERSSELRTPTSIWVKQDGKWPRIVSVNFDKQKEMENLLRKEEARELMDEMGI